MTHAKFHPYNLQENSKYESLEEGKWNGPRVHFICLFYGLR